MLHFLFVPYATLKIGNQNDSRNNSVYTWQKHTKTVSEIVNQMVRGRKRKEEKTKCKKTTA
jgi:hypothetical protein